MKSLKELAGGRRCRREGGAGAGGRNVQGRPPVGSRWGELAKGAGGGSWQRERAGGAGGREVQLQGGPEGGGPPGEHQSRDIRPWGAGGGSWQDAPDEHSEGPGGTRRRRAQDVGRRHHVAAATCRHLQRCQPSVEPVVAAF